MVRLHSRLRAGVEFNPVVGEVAPLANLVLSTEKDRWPLITLGTSSDRIGSPEGTQAFYLTVARRLPGWPVSPYASMNYSEWDERVNFPAGVSIGVRPEIFLIPMYDGDRGHLLVNFLQERWGVTLIWAWFERAGVAVNAGF